MTTKERQNDWEVIHSYSRAQAIEDGVLIDVTTMAHEAGFKIPVALTASAWEIFVKVPEGVSGQDQNGRLWDVLWMCRFGIAGGKNREQNDILFELHVQNDNRGPRRRKLRAVCAPDDNGLPCVTIMMPSED